MRRVSGVTERLGSLIRGLTGEDLNALVAAPNREKAAGCGELHAFGVQQRCANRSLTHEAIAPRDPPHPSLLRNDTFPRKGAQGGKVDAFTAPARRPRQGFNAARAHPFFAREEQEGLSPWHECS